MIRILQILILILLINIDVFAQSSKVTHKIDSLKNILSSKNESTKINILNQLARLTSGKNFEQSYKYAKEQLELAKKINDKKNQGNALHNIAIYYKRKNNPTKAINYFQQSLQIRNDINDSLGISQSYNNIGLLYFNKGEYDTAVVFYEKALKIKESIRNFEDSTKYQNNIKSLGITYNSIGNVYFSWEKYTKALEYYQKAEKYFHQTNFERGIASTTNNMGLIYENLAQAKDLKKLYKAKEYYSKSLKSFTKIDNSYGIFDVNNNLGNVFSQISNIYNDSTLKTFNLDSSKIYYNYAKKAYDICLKISSDINYEQGKAKALLAIGSLHYNTNEYTLAYDYFTKSLEILKKLDDKYNLSVCYNYLGSVALNTKKYTEALKYANKCKEISNEIGISKVIQQNYFLLSEIYDSLHDYRNAYINYKIYTIKKDSTFTEESNKVLQEMQTKYETNKKEQQIKLLNKDQELKTNQIKQQRFIIIIFIVITIIVVFFVILLLRLFNQKKKANIQLQEQKEKIEEQKEKIEEIYGEVTESIEYAKRIQLALIPPLIENDKNISDNFILFKPRDLVSGDFYWLKHLKNKNTSIYAAVDCTGHGVPGAFMSMLGIAFLNEIASKPTINNSAEILNDLRNNIIESLHQKGTQTDSKDGMDVAMVAINKENSTMEFVGANNPVYIIRKQNTLNVNNKIIEPNIFINDTYLFEIKGDKMPIGIHVFDNKPFTNNIVKINKGDKIYIFSDGYADQFGGPKGKKFKYKPFKRLLIDAYNKNMTEQKEFIDKTLVDWIGDLNQIDDILIIGIEI